MQAPTLRLEAEIPAGQAGVRLDRALAAVFPDYSRSRLQRWLKDGAITVDGAVPRPRDIVHGGERVRIHAQLEPEGAVQAQAIPLDICHEDEALLVINKPAGLVVHPGAGNLADTLQNALLHHDPALETLPRAGIVHRLDRDTTGLMVVARTLGAHRSLVEQLQRRRVGREYQALVAGTFTAGGRVEAAIGRHPHHRTRMAVREGGRPAVTHYRILERFPAHTLLRCRLESGRTHQIRVHMAHIRHPIVGDATYGARPRLPPGADEAVREALAGFRRQALHAWRLQLEHPVSGEAMAWEAQPPEDFQSLLAALRAHRDRATDGHG
ncbi:23S rRNA pseudouridine(1911/1915/1917) synthase RluD [Arhodomonas sp. SL1]|uniref:23S rRNA pseudouridine(1911/1915/1917) synthase RluD n=1 Tax=Arhodomonas sp. SL1 TaxID=3425691 RepID=UPI003F882263